MNTESAERNLDIPDTCSRIVIKSKNMGVVQDRRGFLNQDTIAAIGITLNGKKIHTSFEEGVTLDINRDPAKPLSDDAKKFLEEASYSHEILFY